MFHVVTAEDTSNIFWSETLRDSEAVADIEDAGACPENTVRFNAQPLPELLPTTAWVQVPEALLEAPAALEHFFNYRLVIRLATAENHALTAGPGGLLNIDKVGSINAESGFASALYVACSQVEQMGCTADGAIFNPADYWKLAGSTDQIRLLEENGLRIARTRLVPRGSALVGDFGHGARLLDAGRTVIQFADPPPGTFSQKGLSLKAEIYERILLHLPATFYRVDLY